MKDVREIAQRIGRSWATANPNAKAYYNRAENGMDEQWEFLVWPFIKDCDFSSVLDLAAGHGRNTAKLLKCSDKVWVADINKCNLDVCKSRFVGDARVRFALVDGFSLECIPDKDVSLVYCFDSMVHFDSEVVAMYLIEFHRVLRSGGMGFCHHSNLTTCANPYPVRTPGGRNFMSKELFAHYCWRADLEVVRQQVLDWSALEMDCLTLFRKPAS